MVRAITAPGVAQHRNPVPNAALHKGVLVTSGILGHENGIYPDLARQADLVFDGLEAILAEAGAGPQDVVKLDVYLADKADRTVVNPRWEALWPDPQRRPARQAHRAQDLPDGCRIQLVAMAVL